MPLNVRGVRRWTRSIVGAAAMLLMCLRVALAADGRADGASARFVVPGHEQALGLLEDLQSRHLHEAFSQCTLWDAWLPHATLWTGPGPRDRYRPVLLARRLDAEGYVSMQQHRGLAHSEGWPFPAWQQAGGAGFHFSTFGDVFALQMFGLQPLTSTEGWEIDGATVSGIDPLRGLMLKATGDVVTLTTPPFRCGTIVAPFARIEWAARNLPAESRPAMSWFLEGETSWDPARRAEFPPLTADDGCHYANVPLYRQPGYAGMLTRYRIVFDRAAGSEIDLKSLITAIDSRHPITNPLFVIGAADFFCWTGDVAFLRDSIPRLRRALDFSLRELGVSEARHAHVRWVGHDGRSGIVRDAAGGKTVRLGLGVGSNYWDLLPFGGHDAMATMTVHTAVLRLAELEEAIAAHPDWQIAPPPTGGSVADLCGLGDRIRGEFQRRFWNADTGRFMGWMDDDDTPYDYGFTFLNLEAVARGLATPEQARSILSWIDGERTVAGDTAQGADIYHWRFGPRSTTRRNIETYVWCWSNPEDIPWGGQVQDGGAVLGFGYFDLLARIDSNGPDDAWRRLRDILGWYAEVREAGGYRAYYAAPGRGTLQGCGTAGGLGLDCEFMESILVPQVMLSGFLGLRPTPEGFDLSPRLPTDWPSLTIQGIHIHGHVVNVTAQRDGRIIVQPVRSGVGPLVVEHGGMSHVLGTDGRPLTLEGGSRETDRPGNGGD